MWIIKIKIEIVNAANFPSWIIQMVCVIKLGIVCFNYTYVIVTDIPDWCQTQDWNEAVTWNVLFYLATLY